MKKALIFVAALAGLFVAGCVKNEKEGLIYDGEKTWVKATVAIPVTRLSVDMDALSPAWVFNDNIKLETASGWEEFKLKGGQGTKIGTFEGTGEPKVDGLAVYPASHAGNGTYTFPTSYEFRPLNYDASVETGDPISEIPMVGVIRGDDDIKFYHVGGAIALKFNEITPSEHKLIVTIVGNPVTGTATIDADDPDAALVPTTSTGNEITIGINKTTQYTLRNQTILVPVPAGSYSKITVDLKVKEDDVTWTTIAKKSRTKEITVTKGGIFSFAQCTTDYSNTGKQLRAHFPLGGDLNDAKYTNTKMIVAWVNTVDNIAYMDADGSGHEPVSLSSKFNEEVTYESPTVIDKYYQFVRLNQEMLDFGVYTLDNYHAGDSWTSSTKYWTLTQSRGYQMNVILTCADPSSSVKIENGKEVPNIEYYRFYMQTTNGSPFGFFLPTDMEILYKAYKKGLITDGDKNIPGTTMLDRIRTTNQVIEALFGGNYQMRTGSDNHLLWEKPYFEEVTLPDGTKDYILTSPTFDNGYYYTGSLIDRLKKSTATINGVLVGEYVHTKFMLLNAEVVE